MSCSVFSNIALDVCRQVLLMKNNAFCHAVKRKFEDKNNCNRFRDSKSFNTDTIEHSFEMFLNY